MTDKLFKTEYKGSCEFSLGEFTPDEATTLSLSISIVDEQYASGQYSYKNNKGEVCTGTFVPKVRLSYDKK